MNRRSFLEAVIKAGAAAAILPAATTYARAWSGLLVPRGTPGGWRRSGWQRSMGTITARYQFKGAGGYNVKVLSNGKEYPSLMAAARALAGKPEEAVPNERFEIRHIRLREVSMLPERPMKFDVCVIYDQDPTLVTAPDEMPFQVTTRMRMAKFENMPLEFIEENSKYTEAPLAAHEETLVTSWAKQS